MRLTRGTPSAACSRAMLRDDKVFDKDDNALIVLSRVDRASLGPAPKAQLARQFVALVAEQFAAAGHAARGKVRA